MSRRILALLGAIAFLWCVAPRGAAAGYTMTPADWELFEAIAADDTARVEAAVTRGASVNEARDGQGESPLMAACGKGNLEMVKVLKRLGADLNLPVSTGLTYTNALFKSLAKAPVLTYLIENGADFRGNEKTEPLLLEAARTNNMVAAHLLLGKGADVNEPGASGWTALMSAVTSGPGSRGRIEMVQLLGEWGAKIDQRDNDEQTALMKATDPRILAYLLVKGGDVSAADARGNTALSRVLEASALTEKEIVALLRILLGKGAEPDRLSGDRRTPLMSAVWRGHREVAALLLDNGAAIDARDPAGVTALSVAAESHDAEMMQLLIARGADVNARDLFGITPLLHLFNGLPCDTLNDDTRRLAAILLDAGADANLADANNETIVDILRGRGCSQEVLDYLQTKAGTPGAGARDVKPAEKEAVILARKLEKLSSLDRKFYLALTKRDYAAMDETLALGVDLNARNERLPDGSFLITAVRSRDVQLVSFLLARNADPNLRESGGQTPLGAAIGNRPVMELLIDKGADVNAPCPAGDLMEPPLAKAVRQNDGESVRLLLSRGADANQRDSAGSPPLLAALALPDLGIARALVGAGADVNAEIPGDWASPLMNALVDNNGPVVAFLVDAGANVNGRNIRGYSPLLLAVEIADRSIIELLVDKGADLNLSGYGGTTPLLAAVMLNRGAAVVEFLLARGAEANIPDDSGITPLIIAVIRGQKDIAELLLKRGADVLHTDRQGKSPLGYLGERPDPELAALLNAAAASARSGATRAPVGATLSRPEQLLAGAVRAGNLAAARELLDKGVRATTRDEETRRPILALAVETGNLEMVDLLLERGADLSDAAGTTTLHVAVEAGKRPMVEHLLAKGARVNAPALDGGSPLHTAVRLAAVAELGAAVDPGKRQQADLFREIVTVLLDAGADPGAGTLQTTDLGEDSLWSPLHLAAYLGSPTMVGLLVRPEQVNARSGNGNTPLHLAVLTLSGASVLDVVSLLLDRGANPNIKNDKGNGVLQEALLWWDSWPGWGAVSSEGAMRPRWLIMVERLLAGGADLREPGEYSFYPLHAAAESGLTELAGLLLGRGARVNVTDRDGNTPLYLAVRQNRAAMVRLLLGRGADLNPVNRKQFTPLDEARHQMQSGSAEAAEIERLLLASGGIPAGAAAAPTTP